jgi:hypothetical protein
MKRRLTILFIYLPVITLVFCFLANIMARRQDMTLGQFLRHMHETPVGNVLHNGNFEDGFIYWNTSSHEKVSLTNISGTSAVKLSSDNNAGITLLQKIKLNDRHSYRISCSSQSDSASVLVIYSDDKTKKEDYLYCKKSDLLQTNSKTLKPFSSGNGKISLSIKSRGEACFADVSLIDKDAPLKKYFLFLIYAYAAILLIIVVLSFLLESNTTTFFILIVLFVLPLAYLDKSDASTFENRNLAVFKPLFKNKSLNRNFGKDFNEWLNDRFTGRTIVMQAYNIIKCLVDGKVGNDKILAGTDRWYFRKDILKSIVHYKENDQIKFEQTKNALTRFSNFCKNNKSDLYILVMPSNEELYDQYLPGIDLKQKKFSFGPTIDNLRNETGVNIIYAKDVMEKAQKEGLTNYKTDHHWTQLGAFRCYLRIMYEISKTNPDIHSLTEDDFVITDRHCSWDFGFGTQFETLNIPGWLKKRFYPQDAYYKIFDYKRPKDLSKEKGIMLNKNGIDKKVLVLGDSMTHNIINFFWDTFGTSELYYEYGYMHMKNAEMKIAAFKPDITVMIVYYSNFSGIKQWYK